MNIQKLRTNNSGIIFVTVLVLLVVMIVVTISIVSMNVSQVMVTESEVKRIQAEMLAQSAVDYFNATQQINGVTPNSTTFSQIFPGSGVTYDVTINKDTTKAGLNSTDNLMIIIDY